MVDVSRRSLLGAGAGGLAAASVLSVRARAASFGDPDAPPQGAVNAKNPASLTDPGPHSPAIADQFPAASSPPATDTNDMPQFWASFNNAPKRIQNGGWARQVTQADFQISETISGVNMRLTAGGLRELHWHTFAEWAYVTYGSCRITVLDPVGQDSITLRWGSQFTSPASTRGGGATATVKPASAEEGVILEPEVSADQLGEVLR
jgi:oxalate decarboxylase